MAAADKMLIDGFGRRIDYVRLSVTDRCNLRCRYCMTEGTRFLPRAELLTLDEIAALARHPGRPRGPAHSADRRRAAGAARHRRDRAMRSAG